MSGCIIHSTAIIADRVELGENVRVGPYAVIEDDVFIGADTEIGPHCVIHPYTRIGTGNRIHAHVVLGNTPQHTAFKPGTVSRLEIGNNNDIREFVSIHRALHTDTTTRIGSGCMIMASSHIGHDCIIGDQVIITTFVGVAGHVEIGEHAVIGGAVGVHQFVRIGAYAMVGAHALVRKDVMPFSLAGGLGAEHYRLNTIGLRRNGVSGERYRSLEKAYRILRNGGTLDQVDTEETRYLKQWLEMPSKRGLSGFAKATGSDPS